jgi:hypothetical protein
LHAYLQADIKDAFENVAVEEVMRLRRELLTDDRLVGLIETLLHTDVRGQRERTRGIDQGSAYSAHCLNARLHELYDVHIRDDCSRLDAVLRRPDVPLRNRVFTQAIAP